MLRRADTQPTQQQLTRLHAAVATIDSSIEALVAALKVGRPASQPDTAVASAVATLELTAGQRRVCERVINVWETGTARGRYGTIAIFHDGPNRIQQITYGRSQTTEYGNLRELVQMYVEAGGRFSQDLTPFTPKISRTPLINDPSFKSLLQRAGAEDPVMRETQDRFFDRRYFTPAMAWAATRGFTLPLSALVIYDSFIHSGSILDFLRSRFPERPPAQGGDEKTWIRQYVDVRHGWLTNNSNPDVRPSNYRTRDLAREIASGNWQLHMTPFMANGVAVDDIAFAMTVAAAVLDGDGVDDDEIPYLGPVEERYEAADDDQIVCESELLVAGDDLSAAAVADDTAALAGRILESPRITLAATHPSGVVDLANARRNVQDTAAGGAAARSSHGNAPGGTVRLDPRMLNGLLALSQQFSFSVSEIAGGSHSCNSRHYAGIAFDITAINGQRVSASHPDVDPFTRLCRGLGAREVLGPGNAGHNTHVHAAWPRAA